MHTDVKGIQITGNRHFCWADQLPTKAESSKPKTAATTTLSEIPSITSLKKEWCQKVRTVLLSKI